jgi:signal peptidase
VIAFFDPQGNGSTIVTHQVIAVVTEGASLKFQTKGVANNAEDPVPVPAENLVGTYRTKIAGVGNIAMFMQTTTGLILCVVVPVLLIVLYSFIRQRMYENSRKKETEELLAELEALRAEKSGRKEDEKDVS